MKYTPYVVFSEAYLGGALGHPPFGNIFFAIGKTRKIFVAIGKARKTGFGP